MSTLTSSPAFQALQKHYEMAKELKMRDLFGLDADRAKKFYAGRLRGSTSIFPRTGLLARR